MPSDFHHNSHAPARGLCRVVHALRDDAFWLRRSRVSAVIGWIMSAYGTVLAFGRDQPLAGLAIAAAGLAVALYGDHVSLWIAARATSTVTQVARVGNLARTKRTAYAVAMTLGALMLFSAGNAPAKPVPVRAGVAAAAGPPDLSYGGLTSQRNPAFVKLAPGGRRIQIAIAPLDLKCTSGDQIMVPDRYTGLPVSASGRFGTAFEMPPDREGTEELTASGSMRGRFDRGRRTAKGMWKLRLVYRDVNTGQTDDCSGSIRFAVER